MECDKVSYDSQGQAVNAAKRIAKMLGGRKQRAYFCKCKKWHLTTQKKPYDERNKRKKSHEKQ